MFVSEFDLVMISNTFMNLSLRSLKGKEPAVKGFLSFFIVLFLASLVQATEIREIDKKSHYTVVPALNVGYNKLLKGYDGYKNLGNAGADLYIHNPQEKVGDFDWSDHFAFRFSFDYFPLQVPEGVNGVTEDIFAYSGAVIYKFFRKGDLNPRWIPMLGVGAGLYEDRITLDTKATGKVTGKQKLFGENASLALVTPEVKLLIPVRFIPEVRYHRIKNVRDNSTNITFQLAISYWPRQK